MCGHEPEMLCVTYMSVCQVEQVPQPTATAVPALVADAVLQHDVVRSNRTEHFMNLLSRLTCIDLIYLQATKPTKMGKILAIHCRYIVREIKMYSKVIWIK